MRQKNVRRIAALLTALALAVGLAGCGAGKTAAVDSGTEWADVAGGLFDTSYVHEIRVEISEEDWADLLENPLEKTKYAVNVTIDGETVENVSFATKGNTSLSQVAASDSDRYSFKINFGKYEEGQTYHGLDKLNLNNIMSDATYMKDYLSYRIMREAGVSAPLTSYVMLYINGEAQGLYLAIEDVADEFLTRNYGSADGALYKPETETLDQAGDAPGDMQPPEGMQMPDGMELPDGAQQPDGNGGFPGAGGGRFGGMQPPEGMELPDGAQPPDGNGGLPGADGGGFGGMQFSGFGGESGGADLVYVDEDTASYSSIFDNNETDVTEEDERELIAALRALQEGDVDAHWDMAEVTAYFAAHNFVLNYDSYTGTMLHNYYLYEQDGVVSILPWDYNLAFCGFLGGSDATAAVNWAIDSPLSGASEEARPLWQVIAEDETYLAMYHEAFDSLLTNYFENGRCDAEIERVSAMLRPYVAKDPTAFYTVEEFDRAIEILRAFCSLRAQSVRRQLSGALASVSSEQKAEDMVDASALTLSDMGSQGGGRDGDFPGANGAGQGGFPGGGGQDPGGIPGGGGQGQGSFPGGSDAGQGGFPGGSPGGSDPGQGGFPGDPGQGGDPAPTEPSEEQTQDATGI